MEPAPMASHTFISRTGAARCFIASHAPIAWKIETEASVTALTRKSKPCTGGGDGARCSSTTTLRPESPSAQASAAPTMPPPAITTSYEEFLKAEFTGLTGFFRILMRAIHGAHPDGRPAAVQFCSRQNCHD